LRISHGTIFDPTQAVNRDLARIAHLRARRPPDAQGQKIPRQTTPSKRGFAEWRR
jgi:hypothetical protein